MPSRSSDNPWPSLEPGKLRHQIQIQQQSTTRDSFGQLQETWTTFLTKWAQVKEAKQDEVYQSGSLTSRVTHTITMRWDPTQISPGMRILYPSAYGNHYYKIQDLNNLEERNVVLVALVLEIDSAE